MAYRCFLILLLAYLLNACDLFSTRDFLPVPSRTVRLSLLPEAGETLEFRYEERLKLSPGGSDSLLGAGLISLAGWQDTARPCRMMQRKATGSGTLTGKKDTICLDQGDNGLVLSGGLLGAGGMVLPLQSGIDSLAEGDWKILPPGLETGNQWELAAGDVVIRRSLIGRDTVDIGGGIAEAWLMEEQMTVSGETLSQGRYWFGEKGLLKAQWDYSGFRNTNASAEDQGYGTFSRGIWRVF